MIARIYHFDMNNRQLMIDLGIRPEAKDVVTAWRFKMYRLAYMISVNPDLQVTDQLEEAFSRTQGTGTARSTSVGDVVILGEGEATQAYVVDMFGFKPVTL